MVSLESFGIAAVKRTGQNEMRQVQVCILRSFASYTSSQPRRRSLHHGISASFIRRCRRRYRCISPRRRKHGVAGRMEHMIAEGEDLVGWPSGSVSACAVVICKKVNNRKRSC